MKITHSVNSHNKRCHFLSMGHYSGILTLLRYLEDFFRNPSRIQMLTFSVKPKKVQLFWYVSLFEVSLFWEFTVIIIIIFGITCFSKILECIDKIIIFFQIFTTTKMRQYAKKILKTIEKPRKIRQLSKSSLTRPKLAKRNLVRRSI